MRAVDCSGYATIRTSPPPPRIAASSAKEQGAQLSSRPPAVNIDPFFCVLSATRYRRLLEFWLPMAIDNSRRFLGGRWYGNGGACLFSFLGVRKGSNHKYYIIARAYNEQEKWINELNRGLNKRSAQTFAVQKKPSKNNPEKDLSILNKFILVSHFLTHIDIGRGWYDLRHVTILNWRAAIIAKCWSLFTRQR